MRQNSILRTYKQFSYGIYKKNSEPSTIYSQI